jgi:hypothetical protein
MMQRWWIVVLLGTALLGCQLEATSSDGASELTGNSGDPCKAILPKAVIFDGRQQPPIAAPGQIWVIVPSTEGGMTAALVDADKAVIPYVAILRKGTTGGFVDKLGEAAQAVFPGHPNPPPPVIDPDLLVFYARRGLDGIGLAEADVKSCSL